jgi:hypothetical protein
MKASRQSMLRKFARGATGCSVNSLFRGNTGNAADGWLATEILMRPALAFLAGLLLASTIAFALCSFRTGYIKARFMSTVDTPVRRSLDDIVATFDSGDPSLGEAKIRLMQSRWRLYIASGSLGNVHTEIENLTLPKG